ncbi:unnamed protein product [Rotaria sp. Silwood1]|nr:unnamed protein product [Rotaria sp. Silwood1]
MTKASYSLIHESIINIAPIFSTTRVYTTLSVYYIRKKINATDLKYLSKTAAPMKEVICEKGRPPNERYPFQKQHPQTTTHLMMKYSQSHVPILYGPQIPRRDRDDTRERYSRALLTLFVPWRTVADLCDVNQTWEDAFKSRQHLISIHSWKIIENIQLLHECKKDRDEHLLQVIAEAQTDNDAIDPILLPANHDVHGECDMDDSEDLLELLRHLDEHTSTAINTTKKSTENKYIEETIATVENVGRFTHLNKSNSALNKLLHHIKTIGGRVMGSAYSRTALRTRIHALIYNQWLPSIFLTLNPADIHNPVTLYFAGVKLDLDNIQMEQLMDTYKRAEIIASQPVATAKFFHLLISNILNTMISGGVVGSIKAYFGTVESQGRGSLHLHLLIWLDHDMKPADMKEKIQNADFREKLKAYLEDIIKEDLDEFKDKHVFENLHVTRTLNTPPRLSQDNIYAALRTMDLTGLGENINKSPVWSTPIKQQLSPSTPYASPLRNKSLQTPTHDRPTSIMNVLHNQSNINPACLPTPNPSSPNFAARFRADVQMRTEDLRYLQLLERLRHGQCTYDDYELLLTRVVGQPSVASLHDSPWNQAPILVFRNEVRTQLNHKAAIHNATQSGNLPIVCVAQDTCKGKPIEDPTLIKETVRII